MIGVYIVTVIVALVDTSHDSPLNVNHEYQIIITKAKLSGSQKAGVNF